MISPVPKTLITTYLEMKMPPSSPSIHHPAGAHIHTMQRVDVSFYRFLYREVGEKWRWRDRLALSDEALAQCLAQAHTFILYVEGVPAGYIELATQENNCEIVYFGLREAFHGRGLGKYLLLFGIQQAWQLPDIQRVWVHTCNLDGENALSTYQKCGFVIYHQTEEPMPHAYQ